MSTLTQRATGATAIAVTVAPGAAWQLESIRVHLSAVGASGILTAAFDHGAGPEYDFVPLKQDMTSIDDLIFNPERPIEFRASDKLVIAWANAGTKTYGIEIVYKKR